MKLYGEDNPAPNPRRVRIFLAEKGGSVEHVRVPMRERGHKAADFLAKNSLGQLPTLELDDGMFLSESVSICRYLDETLPGPSLFGSTARERAEVDMWIRRIEFQLMNPIGQIWRHTHPLTAALLTQFKDFGESNRPRIEQIYHWLDSELAGKAFIAGEAYSMADIIALTTVDFGLLIGVPIPADCANVLAWHGRVSARPSASA
ncbi:MAG: glutathione S-transferase [Phenylobacterium sp. RIFCSPHIGHO2_01_FULL_69_31]|uniref:glutathione S-transferase family protein n=1 Tax=Phenylobacterium sp. RIFCSPHIGHO2_01_FULL_69_31 TaxID=1801944 RepID=UPI0008B86BC7|nr:glutathione S-transferase [Phenylobacterium sp. RIFCSPHIGHO2_01_FULL_69_31]OHB30324.1 MAG: glutathione S-transferase [Phenylobacterium sp. RIFCSPHIGHO2_01_FULL_69_31]